MRHRIRSEHSEAPGPSCVLPGCLALAALAFTALGGCNANLSSPEADGGDAGGGELGQNVDSSRLGAVGLVGYACEPNDYYPWPFKPVGAATLIGSRTVVTTLDWAWTVASYYRDQPLLFSYGDHPLDAKRTIPIVDADVAPPSGSWRDFQGDFDGWGGFGVMYLQHAPSSITPLDVASVRDDQVGKTFVMALLDWPVGGDPVIGAGRARLLATSGPGFPAIFGDDFAGFSAWFEASWGGAYPPDPAEARRLRRLFAGLEPVDDTRASVLDTGREALVKALWQGTALDNLGINQGAPMMRVSAWGQVSVYGVYSSDLNTGDLKVLDFKTFAPDALSFLNAARDRPDPCFRSPVGDSCDGYKLRTCGADHRTRMTLNCRWQVGHFDATCGVAADGAPGCIMP